MSGFLSEINEKRKETLHEVDWCKSYIWSIEGALTMLRQTVQLPDKDMSPSLKTNLKNVIVQLEECQYHCTMLVAGNLKGTVVNIRTSPCICFARTLRIWFHIGVIIPDKDVWSVYLVTTICWYISHLQFYSSYSTWRINADHRGAVEIKCTN